MFKRIYIELSNYCNLNCIFCTPDNKNSRMLSFKEFKHILGEVKLQTNEICLHVLGEPTIHPDFIKIVEEINKYNIKIMLSTNGVKISELEEELMKVKIDTFNISLHSSYHMNDSLKDDYLNSILQFINRYQEKYTSTFHLRLWADTNETIHKNNTLIKEKLFLYFNYQEENMPRIRLKERVILSYEKEFEWPNLSNNENSNGYCLGGKSHIAILADGTVALCCLDSNGDTNLGNIFKSDLDSILNSEKYMNAIKTFQDNKCYLDLCKHCTYKRR